MTSDQQQQQKALLEDSFDQIFTQNTSFETLNQVLRRLKRRQAELLKVLDRPELPLHNNVSEQDIREFVTTRLGRLRARSDEKSAFEAILFIRLRALKARSRAFFIINLPSRVVDK